LYTGHYLNFDQLFGGELNNLFNLTVAFNSDVTTLVLFVEVEISGYA
jgi:hypothetical protein